MKGQEEREERGLYSGLFSEGGTGCYCCLEKERKKCTDRPFAGGPFQGPLLNRSRIRFRSYFCFGALGIESCSFCAANEATESIPVLRGIGFPPQM